MQTGQAVTKPPPPPPTRRPPNLSHPPHPNFCPFWAVFLLPILLQPHSDASSPAVSPQAAAKSCEDLAEDDRYSPPPDGSSSPLDEDITTPTASLFIDSLTTEGGTLWERRCSEGRGWQWCSRAV